MHIHVYYIKTILFRPT